MKDNAKRMTHSAPNATHAMPKVNAVFAPRSFDWTVMDGECDRIALSQRYDFGPALHARTLLGDDKFSTGEIAPRLGK
jgi:hypothetical protein